jgi:hypothetical protein
MLGGFFRGKFNVNTRAVNCTEVRLYYFEVLASSLVKD